MYIGDLRDLAYGPVLLNGHNNDYHCDLPTGFLSIKCIFDGMALYEIDGGRFAVDSDHYLILNDQQPYKMRINALNPVETFCIFFPKYWASDVLGTLSTATEHLLDEPFNQNDRLVNFFEKCTPHDELVSPQIKAMWQRVKQGTDDLADWFGDEAYTLLERMLHAQLHVYREVEKMPASRPSTRIELYRRLNRARDYMRAYFPQPITLDDIAAMAYLSPYHLLRSFKKVYGQTPHAYLTDLRLEHACHLLRQTDRPISTICFDIGFESLPSFSSLFRRHIGLSPREYRQQHQIRNFR